VAQTIGGMASTAAVELNPQTAIGKRKNHVGGITPVSRFEYPAQFQKPGLVYVDEDRIRHHIQL